jgi:hypothetical protein
MTRPKTIVLMAAVAGVGLLAWVLFGSPEDAPDGPPWKGLWPQDSREAAERAQAASERGDDRYSWQLAPDGEEVVLRYVGEELGWSRPRPLDLLVPEGTEGVLRWRVIRCTPNAANPDYPNVDCAPSAAHAYQAVYVTVERLLRHDERGLWMVTVVEPTEVHQPEPASHEEVRAFVISFLRQRIRGSGAEEYLSADGKTEFGAERQLGALYRSIGGSPYERFEIAFVDGPSWPFGGFEVGVRLFPSSGMGFHDETLFVGPETNRSGYKRPLLILGGRPGLTGP